MPKAKSRARAPAPRFDCAIVGGGPAGLTAALYLARFRRSVVLFQAGTPRVRWAPRIHNFPGASRPIAGVDLLARYRKNLARYPKVRIVRAMATVARRGREFVVSTKKHGRFEARKVLLATGVTDAHPRIPNLRALRLRGLLRYCSICDGFEMRGKEIVILARDDEGLQRALFLATWTRKIRILVPPWTKVARVRRRQIEDLGVRLVRCRTVGLFPRRGGRSVRISIDGRPAEPCSVVYVELGARVNDAAFARLRGIHTTDGRFIQASSAQRTGVPGLYAAGDCVNRLGQVSVATGQAAIAAANIHEELLEP